MKKQIAIILTTLIFVFSSCKKDHTCMCNDPNIDTGGFIIHGTKHSAKKTCESTKNPHNDSKCTLYN